MKNYNLTPKTGAVAGICTVTDDDDVMLIESGGVMIRLHAADVGVYSRAVQGVIVMRVEEGSRVTGVVAVAREEDPPETPETEATDPTEYRPRPVGADIIRPPDCGTRQRLPCARGGGTAKP